MQVATELLSDGLSQRIHNQKVKRCPIFMENRLTFSFYPCDLLYSNGDIPVFFLKKTEK